MNIAYEAVDRHATGPLREKTALLWTGKSGEERRLSYGELAGESNRFANVLASLGVRKGDVVFSLLGRRPELYVAALGTWKVGGVFSPLFSAFGPEPVRARLERGQGEVLVTTPALYEKKVAPVRASLPRLQHVLLVEAGEAPEPGETFNRLIAAASPRFEIVRTTRDDPALLHFTSGTTGMPRARCTCMARWSCIASPDGWRSTCTPTTSSGAPPIRAG